MEIVKVSESQTLARKRGSEREHGVERDGGKAKRASLEEVGGSMSGGVDTKAFLDELEEGEFKSKSWPNLK